MVQLLRLHPAPPFAKHYLKIREGFKTLNPSDEVEDDLLDRAWGLTHLSRLSCQAFVGQEEIVIEIPKYSINHAKENH